MIRRLLLLLFFLPLPLRAQFVAVSATGVTALPNATYTIDFVNLSGSPQLPLLGGISPFPQQITGSFDSYGNMAASVADNSQIIPLPSQWKINVNFSPCLGVRQGFNIQLTLTGASQDITSQLTAAVPASPPACSGSGGGGTPAPPTFSVQFNKNLTNFGGDASFNFNTSTKAVTAQILQGIGNTDSFATGGGNNGIANFFSTYATGFGVVPPSSNDTEAAPTTWFNGASLEDDRFNEHIRTTWSPGGTNPCGESDANGGTGQSYANCFQSLFNNTAKTTHTGTFVSINEASPGFNLGNNIGAPINWSLSRNLALGCTFLRRGLSQCFDMVSQQHGLGDYINYLYGFSDGGAEVNGDEGDVALALQSNENPTYFHGTIVSGGSTGSVLLTTANTSGQNNFTDGSRVLDITQGGVYSGTVASFDSAGAWTFTGASFPVSTAWGTFSTGTDGSATGQYQIPVSQTIVMNLSYDSLASPGAFTTGSNVCVAGNFEEQLPITAVGSVSGSTQSVTFLTRYIYAAGTVIMQGGMCGQAATLTSGSSWRTAIPAIGSFSSSVAVLAGCVSNSGCIGNNPNGLVQSTIGGVGASFTFYPDAEVIGTDGGLANTGQLATNTVPFANGDVIEDPHPAAQFRTGLSVAMKQTTPFNALGGSVIAATFYGPASGLTQNNTSMFAMFNAAPIYSAIDFQANAAYDYFAQITRAPNTAVLGVFSDSDFNIFTVPNHNTIENLASGDNAYGGGFKFLSEVSSASVLTTLQALNVPAVPTAVAQIPISQGAAASSTALYQPHALSGDVSMSNTGAVTVNNCTGCSTAISGLTAGYIPRAGSVTTLTANSHMDDGVTNSGKITSTEPIVIAGTAFPVQSGVSTNTDLNGHLTLSGGTASYSFTSTGITTAPECTASDSTAVAAVQVITTTTTLTINGTGTDVVHYVCSGHN